MSRKVTVSDTVELNWLVFDLMDGKRAEKGVLSPLLSPLLSPSLSAAFNVFIGVFLVYNFMFTTISISSIFHRGVYG
jgi:hypothetical protein